MKKGKWIICLIFALLLTCSLVPNLRLIFAGERKAVYLDAVLGDDDNSGLSRNEPVATLGKAAEIAGDGADVCTIYVMDKITLSDKEVISLGRNKTLARYPEYSGYLMELNEGADVTLTSITIDGSGTDAKTEKSLIMVNSGAVLTIGNNAVLQNNNMLNISDSTTINIYERSGGAVYSLGTVNMNGGVVQKCYAFNGSGIYCRKGVFTLNDGVICNNGECTTYDYVDDTSNTKCTMGSAGGGVMVEYDGRMIQNGGTISGNKAHFGGGGIAVGGGTIYAPTNQEVDSFEMYGGMIENNECCSSGGGMFLQESFSATINSGTIQNNYCRGAEDGLGGGGIYVNGTEGRKNNGCLKIYDVLISKNTSADYGGGIVGCSNSDVEIYALNGGVIYDNSSAKYGKTDIYISDGDGSGAVIDSDVEKNLSESMLGGASYCWKYTGTREDAVNSVLHQNGKIDIYTDKSDEDLGIKKALSMKKVVIAGNTSDTAGGGIASNGDLIIGKKSLSGEDSDKEGSQMEDNQIEYSDNYGTGESILLDSPISTETTEVKAAEIKGTQAVDTPIPTEKSVVENLVATETTQVNTPASTEVPAVQAATSGNPDAGDTIQLFAGVLLMVLSGIGLVGIANFGKKG